MDQTIDDFKESQRKETDRLRKTKKGFLINPITGWIDSRYTDKSKLSGIKKRRHDKLKRAYNDE
jgi:hypothetical protein